MAKVIRCNKVNPRSDCRHEIRGETVDEVLEKAAVHARDHGMKPTVALLETVSKYIEDE